MTARNGRPGGSQSDELMQQKREIARRLIAQGLATRQIQIQLNCSPGFVRQVRRQMAQENTLNTSST